MFSSFSLAYGHAGDDFWYIAAHYYHCFAAQAALLCPNVEFISEAHSEDHQVGLLSHSTNGSPLMTTMFHQRGDHCTSQMVGYDMVIEKIFQIKERKKDYYLLTGYESSSFPTVYLYERHNDDLYLVLKCDVPYSEMANDVKVGDDATIIYNPKKHQWDLCIKNGENWHKIEGTKSCHLHLDKKTPYLEVH